MQTKFVIYCFCYCLVNLAGCASHLRKSCDQTNWYEHGFKVAMSGRRLDEDDLIKKCQGTKAEVDSSLADTGFKAGMAKYCAPDNAFAIGKSGKPFAYEMCDGENIKSMRRRYDEGVRLFCDSKNAYAYGASGEKYQNVCPTELENPWLLEYRRGRKAFLTLKIEEKSKQLGRLQTKINDFENRRAFLQLERMRLAPASPTIERVYDPTTGTTHDELLPENPELANQRMRIESDISDLDWRLNRERNEEQTLNQELSDLRVEMAPL